MGVAKLPMTSVTCACNVYTTSESSLLLSVGLRWVIGVLIALVLSEVRAITTINDVVHRALTVAHVPSHLESASPM